MRFGLVSTSPHVSVADLELLRQGLLAEDAMFSSAWGLRPAEAAVYATEALAPPEVVPLVFQPTDTAGDVLGYHDDETRVRALVLVDPTLAAGGKLLDGPYSLLSVAAHEWLETRADPYANAWVDGPIGPDGGQYALEVCDPVEGEALPVVMSSGAIAQGENFVYPRWLDPLAVGGRLDHAGAVSRSFALAPGGYLIVRDAAGKVSQRFGEVGPPRWRRAVRHRAAVRLGR